MWKAIPKKSFSDDAEQEAQRFRELLQQSRRTHNQSVEFAQVYENLQSGGFEYGQAFQVLRNTRYNHHGEAGALIQLTQLSSPPYDACVIHPTVLDGTGQISLTALSRGGTKPIPTMVPTRVRKVWIANADFHQKDVEHMIGSGRAVFTGYRTTDASIMALDRTGSELRLLFEGFE
jgi:hypothetical protein